MAYLHENKEEFITAINLSSEKFGILPFSQVQNGII